MNYYWQSRIWQEYNRQDIGVEIHKAEYCS